MSATVVQLERPFRRSCDWSANELAEFYRVESVLIQAGLRIDTERGLSDEGDPWFAFCKPNDGDVIVHIARVGGVYILAGPCYDGVATGRDIATLVRDLVSRYPLIQMGGESRRHNSKIFVHPAALLIAVVATAFFKSTEARALGDDQKSGGGDHRVGDSHRGGAAIRSEPYPTLDGVKKTIVTDAAQSAVILSAVVAALQTPQAYQNERGLLPSAGFASEFADLAAAQQTRAATSAFVSEESAFLRHASIAGVVGPAVPAISAQTGAGDVAPALPISNALLSDALTLVVVLWDLSGQPAAPVAAHDANASSTSLANVTPAPTLLSFKLAPPTSSESLPVVQSVKVAYSAAQGTAETHSIAHPDQLPVALITALRDGAHTAIDGSWLDLSNVVGQASSFASALLASVTAHPLALEAIPSHAAPDVGATEAHDSTDHSIAATSVSVNYADVAALVQDFIGHVPVWTRVSEGNQVVLYDLSALTDHSNELKSVTFDFQDGSTLSLVGLPSALPQSLLHQGGATQPAIQLSPSSASQVQIEQSSGTQVQPAQAVSAQVGSLGIEVPTTSWTDHLPAGVANALNDATRAAVGGGSTVPSGAGSLASSLIVSLNDQPVVNAPTQSVHSGTTIPTAAVGEPTSTSHLAVSSTDVKSQLQDFVDHTPNYSVISDGNKLILYDTNALASSPTNIKSVSFDFADGSTLSLIGMPGALHPPLFL